MRTFFLLAMAALLAAPAQAAPLSGGFAYSFIYPGYPTTNTDFNIVAGTDIVTAESNFGPGSNNFIKSQSGPWVNRLSIETQATKGIVYGGATSIFSINQTVVGAPGSVATVSYTFGVEGSFTPGPSQFYPIPGAAPAQQLNFYLLAYKGTSYGVSKQTDQYGDFLYADSSAGHNTLSRAEGTPGYSFTLPAPFAAAAACFGTDTRCTAGGNFHDQRTISFQIEAGDPYFIVGFLSSSTNGQADFFNTAKLLSLDLAPEFGLISQDGGALVRRPNGSFQLAAVPEPSNWALLIAGFGLTGAAMRRRSRMMTLEAAVAPSPQRASQARP